MKDVVRATSLKPALDAKFVEYCSDQGISWAVGLRKGVELLVGVRTEVRAPEVGPESLVEPGEAVETVEEKVRPVRAPESPLMMIDDALREVRTETPGGSDLGELGPGGREKMVFKEGVQRCSCPPETPKFGVRCAECLKIR